MGGAALARCGRETTGIDGQSTTEGTIQGQNCQN